VWVLTGDKVETAINIALASRLFDASMAIVELRCVSVCGCNACCASAWMPAVRLHGCMLCVCMDACCASAWMPAVRVHGCMLCGCNACCASAWMPAHEAL
jgi:magnesium-transporting ATPase (P-type)